MDKPHDQSAYRYARHRIIGLEIDDDRGSQDNKDTLRDVRKAVILSDTHASSVEEMPAAFRRVLTDGDLIIHAGDYTGKRLLDELQNSGIYFRGVYGNMDPRPVREGLHAEEVLEIQGIKIGIAHPAEGGAPWGIERRLLRKFGGVNLIIYGHTHTVVNEVKGGITYINPGSAMGKFPAPYPSIAVLELPALSVMIRRA